MGRGEQQSWDPGLECHVLMEPQSGYLCPGVIKLWASVILV